ncbi:sodium/potassium-transporting ATPase subunit beta-1-interacting protein 2-like isoform X2 [Amphiura filiformis]|uniref:sodium/potassium-transporting ATPase subunit beta-1-interacting protein 2-like isoform X2 n=1 Tax=Amphiura filiformis TaxID=82378 RepID=UPI003B213291
MIMGCCTARCTLITICFLQLIATVERLIFDFLGYMWIPIIASFANILLILFGLFGTYQYRPKFVIVYILWHVVWLGWNIFIMCLYLSAGVLNVESHMYILNLHTGSESWWKENGFNCSGMYNTTTSSLTGRMDTQLLDVNGCILDYTYIEIIHASVQCLLCLLGISGAIIVLIRFAEDEDSFDFIGGFDSLGYGNSHAQKSPNHLQMQPIYMHHKTKSR